MHAVSRTATATLSSRPPARPPSRRARAVVARASSSSDDVVPPLATLGERARNAALTLATSAALVAAPPAAMARLEGVNNPQMLPPGEPVEVLDVAGYLTKGEIARLTSEVRNLEKDTGIRLRVLAQAYPNTPGLAVKDYWKVDDDTVVFVADPGLGNILNFSVGANVDLEVPPSFWTRLAGTGAILLAGKRRGGVHLQRRVRHRHVLPRGPGEAQVREGAGGAGRAALEREVWKGVVRTVEAPRMRRHIDELFMRYQNGTRLRVASTRATSSTSTSPPPVLSRRLDPLERPRDEIAARKLSAARAGVRESPVGHVHLGDDEPGDVGREKLTLRSSVRHREDGVEQRHGRRDGGYPQRVRGGFLSDGERGRRRARAADLEDAHLPKRDGVRARREISARTVEILAHARVPGLSAIFRRALHHTAGFRQLPHLHRARDPGAPSSYPACLSEVPRAGAPAPRRARP